MTKKEKLRARLLTQPRVFTYSELRTILKGFGYTKLKSGKTSGSRMSFFHPGTKHIIRLHRPQPGSTLKYYQINQIIAELKKEDLL
ncbi:MAG: type II toxin-antitoxin system HicA family toxin [Bacteroidales bacterium]|nr:type II toxin-antitoxin system HicA family toxin [Bacteroidales bacterium]